MKIKTLIIAAVLFAFTPVLAFSQNYEYLGREGKAMAVGEIFWKWLKGDDKKDEKTAVASPAAKRMPQPAAASKRSQSAPYYLMGREGKMMALGEALQNSKKKADAKLSKKEKYRRFVEAEVNKIPAEQKAHYDALVKSENWHAVEDQIKWFSHFGNPKFNYDADKYYILQATVKVNGKYLASIGSLRVALAIMDTSDKFKSWAYKEAEKVQRSISHSGQAL